MDSPKPICSDTKVDDSGHTWIPCSFSAFLQELSHLSSLCSGDDPLPLYRGHANNTWLLESTIARSCKQLILGLKPEDSISQRIQQSVDYHRVVLNILLLKFGVILRPPDEDANGGDPWHEFMRDLQQYPERDNHHFKGTFYIDWSRSQDIALFFANYNRHSDGALWICDTVATGRTLQEKQVGEILDLMNERCNKLNPDAPGCPLIFHPPVKNPSVRASRQQAVYIAQMDLRFDLASIWEHQENDENANGQIFIKLILPNGTQHECSSYLMKMGMIDSWLFPNDMK